MDPRSASDRPGALAPLPPHGQRVFLTDLHLDGADTPRALAFRALLRNLAAQAAQTPTDLYLLGDLFQFWEEYHRQVAAIYEQDLGALEEAHRAGVRIVLLFGNRDFALGRYVKRRLGATIFGDGGPVQLSDSRWIWIEHGDLLCTADRRYRRYRKIVRSFPVRLLFWLLPWSLARRLIGNLRDRTSTDKAAKSKATFEIDLDAARRRLEDTACKLLLCGHTHRPQTEDLGAGLRLLALPAWCEVPAGYVDRNGSLQAVRFNAEGVAEPATYTGEPRPEN